MTTIELTRGSTSTRNLDLYITTLEDLPAEFDVVMAVKQKLDTDITDSKAIIKKTYTFPDDFTLVEPAVGDDYYTTPMTFTYEDSTQPQGTYLWNVRLLTSDKTFVKDTSTGQFIITLTPTQTQ